MYLLSKSSFSCMCFTLERKKEKEILFKRKTHLIAYCFCPIIIYSKLRNHDVLWENFWKETGFNCKKKKP
ncbi:hypothetical protein ES288_A05G405000v1 [Gossypium darwinii]|uniref:Uncharacterized protein n=1 Tax=Gossypium darwinii TaxID=34276 RepID=A0A5D2GQA8_GOSDA|nr:hypothetical protein ES288_A05G405000v1 [Gossypium darwinii]